VHLKSLTLRGFKSFASATTLRFEPGITCVVGPNGSGKSNVVDALSWVMGEQGAKSLRGRQDGGRHLRRHHRPPPLGRAEVSLTIDNSDGVLPIEYAEVTITRIMFRNGGSEYQINGDTCRLLDIQELLSDSGIGRGCTFIVGQGQLDSYCTPTRWAAAPSSRRRPGCSSTASARRRRCGSWTRCRPTWPGSPTSPESCAASSSRSAGRPRSPPRRRHPGRPARRAAAVCSPTNLATLREALRRRGRRRGRAPGAPGRGRGRTHRGLRREARL